MSPRINKILSFYMLVLFLVVGNIMAKDVDGKVKKVKGTENIMGSPSRTHFNVNSVSTWLYNNGDSDIKPDGNSGFVFPKGSNKTVVFESGFVWGADVNGQKRVGGGTYNQGLLPGSIIGTGASAVREDENLDHVRIYRVRRDYNLPDADFSAEINDGEGSKDEIYSQYDLDWKNWPAQFGAPYDDLDKNGSYDPKKDIPGVPGADQTIWFVANDLDVSTCQSLYGSDPMGIEMQATFWGYNSTGAIGNMMFRKYIIINKSVNDFDSMYVSMWSDPDLGDATDDFSGCDVDLSMMFTYNGNASDATYGITPPAIGFDFFQGPIVEAEGETAIYKGAYKTGYKNLPMSVHYFFINGDPVYNDPDLGEYETGTLQFHNLFRGRVSTSGTPFIDPTTGVETKFTLSGDVVSGSGWVDGLMHPPGDRRQGMVAGPFTMAVGDTQEVVVAELTAGAFENVDRISAVQLLKFYDLVAQSTYDNFFQVPATQKQTAVNVTELDQEVVLSWDADLEIENYSSNGYEFQGYVVYQLPTKAASFNDAKIVATFDLNDGIGKVFGPAFDSESGSVLEKLLKSGSDSGIKRNISLKKDLFKSGAPLFNGTPYYFAVTSYGINPNDLTVVPTVIESAPIILEVIPQGTKNGYSEPVAYSSDLEVTHIGTANATSSVKVIQPFALTGDKYELSFKQTHYYLGSDGKWHGTNYPDSIGKVLSKDISPAYLTGVSYIASSDIRDLKFTVQDLEASPDYSYCDGIQLTIPAGVNIISALPSGNNIEVDPVINGQVVTWGAEDTTQNGPFSGGEVLTVRINGNFALPLSVDYTMWDDGWGFLSGPDYGITGEYKNATGIVVVSEEANYFRTENNWRITNKTTETVVLDNQRVFGGIDKYADFWDVPANVGIDAAPIIDGYQVSVDGSFEAPIEMYDLQLTAPTDGDGKYSGESTLTTDGDAGATETDINISNYTIFGGTISSWAFDNFEVGTTEIDQLQQDYEIRFNGVYASKDVSGQTVYEVVSGGQMATCFRMSNAASLATNPFNPNYGTAEPFLIRVPFEVWNVEDPANPYQVNFTFRDRVRNGSENPFYAWNMSNRMYGIVVNSPYNPDQVIQVDGGLDEFNSLATWVLVFYGTNYHDGDVVKITYANPLQIGKDTFTFETNASSFNKNKAKTDVAKINVFPNPYYGVNPNEINKYQRFVTFNHLPPHAIIRVFNLAGQLVKTVQKNDVTQFARWDLQNESRLPVASGIYIVYIDMPEIGETKILKVAIIQETQILDRF